MGKIIRHILNIVFALIIMASALMLVVFNTVDLHFSDPAYLLKAAKETDYAGQAAKFVEDQLGNAAGNFGLDKKMFVGTIKTPSNVYDEMHTNIEKVFSGEKPKVNTSLIREGIKEKFNLPLGVTDSIVNAATTMYSMAMSFEVLLPTVKEIKSLLYDLSSINILLPIVLAVLFIIMLIINRRYKSTLFVYIFLGLFLAGGVLVLAAQIYFSQAKSLFDLLAMLGISVDSSALTSVGNVDFAMDLIKAFTDSMVASFKNTGFILGGIGILGAVLLMLKGKKRQTA